MLLQTFLFFAFNFASEASSPPNPVNLTLYGLRPINLTTTIVNKDTADPRGDIFFYFGDRLLIHTACRNDPSWYLCKDQQELEYNNVYTKYLVQVDSTFGGCPSGARNCSKYGACNPTDKQGNQWSCRPTTNDVGIANVSERYTKPHGTAPWDIWKFKASKMIGGFWYSTQQGGECNEIPGGAACQWKMIETLQTLNATCVNDHIEHVVVQHASDCLNTCANPADKTTDCWAKCFYNTLFSGNPAITPMTLEAAWHAAFNGGCPNVPPEKSVADATVDIGLGGLDIVACKASAAGNTANTTNTTNDCAIVGNASYSSEYTSVDIDGTPKYTTRFLFSSINNMIAFENSPIVYLPKYGGFDGFLLGSAGPWQKDFLGPSVDLFLWTVLDDQVYLFANRSMAASFLQQYPSSKKKADQLWSSWFGQQGTVPPYAVAGGPFNTACFTKEPKSAPSGQCPSSLQLE
jgi:hypothetical protein